MARPINRRTEKYPYDRWFNGRKRTVKRGEHYECATVSMRQNLIKASSARGFEIHIHEASDDQITFTSGERA